MNYWLWQANPAIYDLTKEIELGRTDDWELNQHRAKVTQGDCVIFWQSGKQAGIYGLGKLRDKVGEDRINIDCVEQFESPISKQTLLADPVLSTLLVLRAPFSANPFSVTESQWEALRAMRVPAQTTSDSAAPTGPASAQQP